MKRGLYAVLGAVILAVRHYGQVRYVTGQIDGRKQYAEELEEARRATLRRAMRGVA